MDITLRIISIMVLLLVLRQNIVKDGGQIKHVDAGYSALVFGVIIFLLVALRGSKQEVMSIIYAIHLVVGLAFFICLFYTCILGMKMKDRKWYYTPAHRKLGRLTLVLLIATLVIGIASKLSHN